MERSIQTQKTWSLEVSNKKRIGQESHDEYVIGRIRSTRSSSNKLFFFDVTQDGHKLQVLCNYSSVKPTGMDEIVFRDQCKALGRGDVIRKSADMDIFAHKQTNPMSLFRCDWKARTYNSW